MKFKKTHKIVINLRICKAETLVKRGFHVKVAQTDVMM